MSCKILHLLSFAAVASAVKYDELRDRPFDSLGSQPFVGRSAPAVSIEDASRFQTPVFTSGRVQAPSDESFGSSNFDQLSSGDRNPLDGQQFGSTQFSTTSNGLGRPQASGQSFGGSISSGFSSGQGSGNVFAQGSPINAPTYEEHLIPRSGPLQVTSTVTNFVTKTHTLRVPATSDVWITSVTLVRVPVTQLSTRRNFIRGVADTVTSLVRITTTPVSVATQTVNVFPTKTFVSVFTNFVTETDTVELWQPIQHLSTSYEVMTRPILETQTLLQRAFRTVTVTRTVDVTSLRQIVFPRGGRASAAPAIFGGY